MSSDLQADISTRLKGNGLTQATQGVDKLKTATDKAANANRDLQAKASAALGATANGAKTAEERMKRLKTAVEGLEGPLGTLAKRLIGAGGMADGWGRVAAGIGIATFAAKAFMAVTEANIARAKAFVAAAREIDNALDAADKTRKQQGLSAASVQGNSLRLLETRAGESGLSRANQLASSGAMTADDARSGVAQAYLIPEREKSKRDAVINIAKRLAQTGETSFTSAVNLIMNDKMMMQMLNDPSQGEDVARRSLVKMRGQDATASNMLSAESSLARSDVSAQYGGFTNRLNTIQGIVNDSDVVGQARIKDGTAELAAREQMAATRDPESAGMVELFKRQQDADREMRELIKAQGVIMAGIKDVLTLVGGEGSYRNQLRVNQVARGRAALPGETD